MNASDIHPLASHMASLLFENRTMSSTKMSIIKSPEMYKLESSFDLEKPVERNSRSRTLNHACGDCRRL